MLTHCTVAIDEINLIDLPGMSALHYKWADLPQDFPIAKIARRIVRGESAMIAEVRLDKGFKVDTHTHVNEQFACVLSGRMLFGIGEESTDAYHEVEVLPGEVLLMTSNLPHSAEALEDSVLFDIFAPPAEQMGVDAQGKRIEP